MKKILKWIAIVALALLVLILALGVWAWQQTRVNYTRVEDVIYGRKFGTALTLDVFRPEKQNGFGIVYLVSGGWRSSHDGIVPLVCLPFLKRGYTVFAVVHGSQPKFSVPEIAEDVHRAVRFIRHNAAKYGIDPNRLSVTGGSAGGHLSLILATRGANGPTDAKDPVDRASSAVQCVAIFYPVTDLLNLGSSTENPGDGGPPKSFKDCFGPSSKTMEGWRQVGRELSPIYFVTSNLPPTLILHGDADTLVPLDQSERFVSRAKDAGATIELVVKPGKGHGWLTLGLDVSTLADWFDEHLRALKK